MYIYVITVASFSYLVPLPPYTTNFARCGENELADSRFTVHIQRGRVLGTAGTVFGDARIIARKTGRRELDEQHGQLSAHFVHRYTVDCRQRDRFGVVGFAKPPRYVQRRVALGHQARDLRRLTGIYRLVKVERDNARRY